MRVLSVSPSTTVYDHTLHYYQAVFSAAGRYFRRRFPQARVASEPGGLTGAPERVFIRHLVEPGAPPGYVLLWTRVWEAPAALRLARLAREVAPGVRILVWGEACVYIPHFFRRAPFDGMVTSGDPERVLADAIERLEAGLVPEHGMELAAPGGWISTAPGLTLDPSEWPYPDLDAIRPVEYTQARLHRGKATDDLSFTVSRGCPINCAAWCPTPRKEGLKDRRRPAADTVAYMERGPQPYDLFQLHSPLFSHDRAWVEEFVALKRRRAPEVQFKTVDLANPYAEEGLVADLAGVGLRYLGFGVETLSHRGRVTPKLDERLLARVAANLARYGIRGKAYIQLGLPGQTREDVFYTLRVLRDLGISARPTGATPFYLLRRKTVEELDGMDLSRWDRKSFYHPRCPLTPSEFYALITCPDRFPLEDTAPWAA